MSGRKVKSRDVSKIINNVTISSCKFNHPERMNEKTYDVHNVYALLDANHEYGGKWELVNEKLRFTTKGVHGMNRHGRIGCVINNRHSVWHTHPSHVGWWPSAEDILLSKEKVSMIICQHGVWTYKKLGWFCKLNIRDLSMKLGFELFHTKDWKQVTDVLHKYIDLFRKNNIEIYLFQRNDEYSLERYVALTEA